MTEHIVYQNWVLAWNNQEHKKNFLDALKTKYRDDNPLVVSARMEAQAAKADYEKIVAEL
jgi:hypothetical protein